MKIELMTLNQAPRTRKTHDSPPNRPTSKPILLLFSAVTLLMSWICLPDVSAQITTVGSGSYTTAFPGTDVAGRNTYPTGTPGLSGVAATKPVPTNDWWSNFVKVSHGGQAFNYPLSYRSLNSGVVVNLTVPPGAGPTEYRQPMGDVAGIVVGVDGLNATQSTAANHSDWTVTMNWNAGGKDFSALMGIGMPFTYFTKGSSDLAKVSVNHNPGGATISGNKIIITNNYNGANYVVFGPAGTVWSGSGGVYTSNLNGKNFWSMVMLPAGVDVNTAIANLTPYAYVFPGNTQVAWSYTASTGVVRTTFTVTPDVKEGTANVVLQGLLPHQWSRLASGSPTPSGYTYNTVRGQLKMLASNSFIVENKFSGILPTLPNLGKYSGGFDPGALYKKIDLMKNDGLAEWTDSYNEGQAMNRLVQAAHLAHQLGHTEARDKLINTVKARLEDWFKAEGGEVAFIFYYNNTWKTMIGYPAGHRQDENLNDHHFHWGYFIHAAAAIEQYQPGWASQWGGMVDLLIRDASNPSRTDTMFPFLRNFSPYAGHCWANGFATEPFGNDQESTSESMQFNSSLIHWGTVTGNTAVRDLGIYFYTTEQSAVEEYWFDQNDRTFQPEYVNEMVARIWGGGYDNGTWWTQDIAAAYGIQLYPIHGGALYMGHNTAYVQKVWDGMKAKTQVLNNTPNDNLWYDTYWSFLSFLDPQQAINLYNAYPNRSIKFGISDAQTYHWLHTMNAMGQVADEVTANYPIAAVFNKSGVKTYVAHNYGASAITVNFSDGYSMSVPARSMATNRDINISVTLAANATQVPTNGTINLTATTTGTGITKVEFYRDATLLGTDTSAPYTLTTPPLAAGLPNFHARAYVGTNHNVSNIIAVQAGSQVPYTGTPAAIPGTIEAGNYDAFEGGSGQGVSYSDATSWNEGNYRTTEAVDAGTTTNEGVTVGWIDAGEWLEYTVNVAQAGSYDVTLRYTSGNTSGGGPFWFENAAGTKISPDITVVMNDVNWSTYANKVVTGVNLSAGQQVIRVKVGSGGFNLGRMTFVYAGGDATPPTAPSNLTSPSKTMTSINLSWTGSTDNVGVTGYEVYVNSETTPRATVTTTSATISGLIPSTSYNFRVRAKDAVPNYSGYSNTLTVSTNSDTSAPTAPANLASPTKTNNSVSLSWTASTDNVGVTGYEVYVNTETTPRATVTTTSATITGLTAATTYAFRVRAKDAVPNFSAYSSTLNVTTDGTTLPAPWVTADIGAVGAAGGASHSSGTFTVVGSGADIWGTADEFRFVYQSISGDFTLTARLASLGNTDPWAKAGVMAREGTAANGRHVLTAVTISNGLAFQRRTTAGAESIHTAGPAGATPYWVRIQRTGNVFTSFVSSNGTAWTQVGTETIPMTSAVNVGLAVTSHNDGVLSTAVFDNVSITTGNVAVTGVTVSPASATITTGGTQQLTATVAPANATNKTVSWSSSNSAVATVNSSGLVTAVAAGSAIITVTTQDGNRTATSAITVTTANVPVTGVSVSPTSATINAGSMQQLTATVAPANATNKNVSWSSNNNAVATVSSSGVVSGVAAGSATITVTTQDGNRTATSVITVTGSGGTNLALNRPTTTSSNETAAFPGSLAVDGNATTTRWSSLFSDPQWIYVDLGSSYNVNRVKVTWEAAYATAYLVQISSDASNWTNMKSVTGNATTVNDHTGLTGTGRYVRIYGTARATVYGYSIFELEVYGTPTGGGGTCLGSDAIGDYTYQVSTTSGTVNWTFIPGAPIAGSTLSIIYVKVGSGGYAGYTMNASGSNFTFSQAHPAGTSLTFYFTYRVGNTATERSSVANPHTYSAGATCGARAITMEEEGNQEDYDLYPNPVVDVLTIRGGKGGSLGIVNAQGISVKGQAILNSDDTDVSSLPSGVYHAILIKNNKRYVKRFMKVN